MRSPVADLLVAFAGVCKGVGIRWYLFGAQAALVHGAARLTGDVDVTVQLGACAEEKFVSALQDGGFTLRVSNVREFVGETRVVPAVHTDSGVPIDVVLAGPGIEEIFLERARYEEIEPGLSVPVACPEDLVIMKVLAGRPKDLQDAAAICAAQGARLNEGLIRSMLSLLEEALDRRDLLLEFEHLLSSRTTDR
jgi:hypothetical protein